MQWVLASIPVDPGLQVSSSEVAMEAFCPKAKGTICQSKRLSALFLAFEAEHAPRVFLSLPFAPRETGVNHSLCLLPSKKKAVLHKCKRQL